MANNQANPFGFIQNIEENTEPTEQQKTELEEAVEGYQELKSNKKRLEDATKAVNKSLQDYERNIIPSIMRNQNQTSATLIDGTTVSIDHDVYVTVTNESAFIAFLEEHGSLEKMKYVVEVAGTEHEAMREITGILKKRGLLYNVKAKMHSASQQKFWRDMLVRTKMTDGEKKTMHEVIEKFATVYKFMKTSLRKSRKQSTDDIPF